MKKERTHTTNKIIIAVMVIVFLLASVFFFGSCNARKKAKQSKVYLEQVKGYEMKSLVSVDQTKSYETANTLKTINTIASLSDFEGQVSDPTKPAFREIDTSGGKIRETFHNFSNVKSKSEAKAETISDTTSIACETKNDIKFTDNSEKKTETHKKSKGKVTETQTSRTSIWLFVLIFAVVAVFILVGYFRKKNPKNWIK